jgi:hypothetical protein
MCHVEIFQKSAQNGDYPPVLWDPTLLVVLELRWFLEHKEALWLQMCFIHNAEIWLGSAARFRLELTSKFS